MIETYSGKAVKINIYFLLVFIDFNYFVNALLYSRLPSALTKVLYTRLSFASLRQCVRIKFGSVSRSFRFTLRIAVNDS
jgi:hypothetical protein